MSLGKGKFGEVFKGKWLEQHIAAKRIEDTSFFVELKISHQYGTAENILPLLAISYERSNVQSKPYLVYLHMENGSVFQRLKDGEPKL